MLVDLTGLLLSAALWFSALLSAIQFEERISPLVQVLDRQLVRTLPRTTPAGTPLSRTDAIEAYSMGVEQRGLLFDFLDEARAARPIPDGPIDGQDARRAARSPNPRLDAALREYVDRADPGFHWGGAVLELAGRSAALGDADAALDLYRRLRDTPQMPDGLKANFVPAALSSEVALLMGAGRREEALNVVRAIPQAGVGGVRSGLQVSLAHERSRFLLMLGREEEARLSFLSQTPPDDLSDPATKEYGYRAVLFLEQVDMFGTDAGAYRFGTEFLTKRPDLATPAILTRLASLARRLGRKSAEAEFRRLADSLRTPAQARAAAARAIYEQAQAAAMAGRREEAIELFDTVLDDPDADDSLRLGAVQFLERLEPEVMGGVFGGPEELRPIPMDPADIPSGPADPRP